MRVENIAIEPHAGGTRLSADLIWEDASRLPFEFTLDTNTTSAMAPDQAGNALLAVAFPMAFHDRERRLLIDGEVCPMLADNMLTVLDCWNTWEPGPGRSLKIEARKATRPQIERCGASGFMSGGVDSLHMLHRNLKVHAPGTPAAIGQVILVYGFDFGKRPKHEDRDKQLFASAAKRLKALCATRGVELVTCETNLRRIRLSQGFWTDRFYGAAVMGTGHAMVPGEAYLMLAGTYNFASLGPIGSNPAIDVQFSSQRLQVVHEGLRYSRQQKVRELLEWPDAIDNLRVCAFEGRADYNCGTCEKCVRTRLGLLGAGAKRSVAFGAHEIAPELLGKIELDTGYQVACYSEIAVALRGQGHDTLAAGIEARLAARPKNHVSHART